MEEEYLLHILIFIQVDEFKLLSMTNLMILSFKLSTFYYSAKTYPMIHRMAFTCLSYNSGPYTKTAQTEEGLKSMQRKVYGHHYELSLYFLNSLFFLTQNVHFFLSVILKNIHIRTIHYINLSDWLLYAFCELAFTLSTL